MLLYPHHCKQRRLDAAGWFCAGLIAAAPGRRNSQLQNSSKAVEGMVRQKMDQKEYILLCLEDTNDWSNATTRRLIMQVAGLPGCTNMYVVVGHAWLSLSLYEGFGWPGCKCTELLSLKLCRDTELLASAHFCHGSCPLIIESACSKNAICQIE